MIRAATAADAGAIAAIWNPVIRDTSITFDAVEKTGEGLAETIRTRQAKGHAFLVAAEAGQVLGFATYGPFRAGPGYARTVEHTVMVARPARGRGIGHVLMTALQADARARGMHSMIGGISGENTQGIAFHQALGFARVALVPETGYKFGRWLDLVLMQKFL